ncbi:MAG: hypothetical protein GF308_05510 [Candidatus Heimdallarchaeota archaeon]|nr:hypothetical protein [Candidatus Heimdallarchaeota archaeon]
MEEEQPPAQSIGISSYLLISSILLGIFGGLFIFIFYTVRFLVSNSDLITSTSFIGMIVLSSVIVLAVIGLVVLGIIRRDQLLAPPVIIEEIEPGVNTFFNRVVMEQIENHLEVDTSNREVYGWLLGYDEGINVHILASMPCFNYDVQTVIAARPTPEEINLLSSSLPEGLGVVGIYHSHPDEVFHSKTDDNTVFGFGSTYSNFVSLVTNRDGVVKVYRILDLKKKVIRRVNYEVKKVTRPPKLSFSLQVAGKALVDKEYPFPSLTTGIRKQIEGIFAQEPLTTMDGKAISSGDKVSKIVSKSSAIKFGTPESQEWEDPNAPEHRTVEYNVSGKLLAFYPKDKVLSQKTIDSIRISLTNVLLRKVSLGDIKQDKLLPGETYEINYLDVPLHIIYGSANQPDPNSVKFIKGLAFKSLVIARAGFKKPAVKTLKSCKEFFETINDTKEIEEVEEMLSKIQ